MADLTEKPNAIAGDGETASADAEDLRLYRKLISDYGELISVARAYIKRSAKGLSADGKRERRKAVAKFKALLAAHDAAVAEGRLPPVE